MPDTFGFNAGTWPAAGVVTDSLVAAPAPQM